MSKRSVESNFDFAELKNQVDQIKKASEDTKKQPDSNTLEVKKQSLGQKVLGIIVLLAVVVGVIFVLLSSLDTLFLPKNSITVVVSDQEGNVVEGLKLTLQSDEAFYEIEYIDNAEHTVLDAETGDYILSFNEIPDGYTCSETFDNFSLDTDGKIKLEYECQKND